MFQIRLQAITKRRPRSWRVPNYRSLPLLSKSWGTEYSPFYFNDSLAADSDGYNKLDAAASNSVKVQSEHCDPPKITKSRLSISQPSSARALIGGSFHAGRRAARFPEKCDWSRWCGCRTRRRSPLRGPQLILTPHTGVVGARLYASADLESAAGKCLPFVALHSFRP